MEAATVHEVINLLRGIWKGFEKEWNAQARSVDLTQIQQHVLWALYFEDGISLSVLSERTLLHITTAGDVVRRLQERGTIRVETSTDDIRALSIFLTDAGRKKVRESAESGGGWRFFERLHQLSPEESDLLLRILKDWASYFQGNEFVDWVTSTAQTLRNE